VQIRAKKMMNIQCSWSQTMSVYRLSMLVFTYTGDKTNEDCLN